MKKQELPYYECVHVEIKHASFALLGQVHFASGDQDLLLDTHYQQQWHNGSDRNKGLLTVASFAAEEEVFDAVKSQSRLVPDC
jgi:hypothetical protein